MDIYRKNVPDGDLRTCQWWGTGDIKEDPTGDKAAGEKQGECHVPEAKWKTCFRVFFSLALWVLRLRIESIWGLWDCEISFYKNFCFSSENSKLHLSLNSQDASAAWQGQTSGSSRPYFSCQLHLLLPRCLRTNDLPSHQTIRVMPLCPMHKLMKRFKELISG